MSDSSASEPFQDSGSEYVPSNSDTDSDDSLSSISDTDADGDNQQHMGDFAVLTDPFSVRFLFYVL